MVVSGENLNLIIGNYIDGGVSEDLEKLISDGDLILLGKNDLGPCVKLTFIEYQKFDLGFNYKVIDNSKHLHITDVNPEGQAYKAGVRKDQKVIGKSIYWNQPDKLVKLRLKNSKDSISTVEYLPLGEKIRIPQYKLNNQEFTENPDSCIDWFFN